MSDTVEYAKWLRACPEDPLPTEAFDAAWYPSGPTGRGLLVAAGYATEASGGITLTAAGIAAGAPAI